MCTSPGEVWLVRHGTTEWSLNGRHTGRTDLPLTSDGQEAATALRPVLRGHEFTLVLSSPLLRARDTAQLAGFTPELDEDLREWDYGKYEGRTTADILAVRPEWSIWKDGVPGGESPDDLAARADRVITRVRSTPGDSLLFAHGHLLRVLGARWVGSAASAGRHLLLATAAVCVLGYERDTPALARWNDTSHLAGR